MPKYTVSIPATYYHTYEIEAPGHFEAWDIAESDKLHDFSIVDKEFVSEDKDNIRLWEKGSLSRTEKG